MYDVQLKSVLHLSGRLITIYTYILMFVVAVNAVYSFSLSFDKIKGDSFMKLRINWMRANERTEDQIAQRKKLRKRDTEQNKEQ